VIGAQLPRVGVQTCDGLRSRRYLKYVPLGRRVVDFNSLNVDLGKPRGVVKRVPGSVVTEVEAIFWTSKVRRGPRMDTAHLGNAARAQDSTYFRQRPGCIRPEMNHSDREDSIEAGLGEGHPLRRTEVQAHTAGSASSTIVGEISMPV